MTDYILGNCPHPNQLIKAVMADLSENVYLAGPEKGVPVLEN